MSPGQEAQSSGMRQTKHTTLHLDHAVRRPGKLSCASADYEHNASWGGVSSLAWGPTWSMSQLCSYSRVSHSCQVCHTAASTLGSCVLEGTAGTEGRQRLPSPHSQKYLQKPNKQTHRNQGRQRVTSTPLRKIQDITPGAPFTPRTPLKHG